MIREITTASKFDAKKFEMPWSLFPYANFVKYGFSNSSFRVFFLNDSIFTMYDDSIQICSASLSHSDVKELVDFLSDKKIRMIAGPREVINRVSKCADKGIQKNGFIFLMKKIDGSNSHEIAIAKTTDEFHHISSLVCAANSSNKSYYTEEQFYNQIYTRFTEKYCRNFICRLNGEIVGHIATYAEAPSYAVIAGLAVSEQHRRKGIAKDLLSHIINELLSENKRVYSFCYNDGLIEFYKKNGFISYEYSKLLLND